MIITGLALGSARHCARLRLRGGQWHGSNPKKQPVALHGLSVPRPARLGEKLVFDFDCTQATETIPRWAADEGDDVADFHCWSANYRGEKLIT